MDRERSDSIFISVAASPSPPEAAEEISEQNGIENGLQMRRKWCSDTSLIVLPDVLHSPWVAGMFQLATASVCI